MLKIIDWPSFQSYKDRRPPWIRFSKQWLDDFKFQRMSADARALLPMLWLLASEDEDPVSGLIRDDYETVSFRLRLDPKIVINAVKECVRAGLVEEIGDPALPLLAHQKPQKTQAKTESYKSVTETSRFHHSETETETETDNITLARACARPPEITETLWRDFQKHRKAKRAPVTETVIAGFRREAKIAGITLDEAINHSITQGWQGFRADWYKPQPTKGNQHHDRKQNRSEIADAAAARALAKLEAQDRPELEPQSDRDAPPMLRPPEHLRPPARDD